MTDSEALLLIGLVIGVFAALGAAFEHTPTGRRIADWAVRKVRGW